MFNDQFAMKADNYSQQKDEDTVSTRTIVSRIAYLIGVNKSIFEKEHEPPRIEIFDELENEKSARIIRCLSMLRTAIERNFIYINNAMRYELKNLDALPQYIPQYCLASLEQDGIDIIKVNHRPDQYVMDINMLIARNISACKQYFPIWLNWEYVRSMFLMPDGQTKSGIKKAASVYYANIMNYPYQVYINWRPTEQGNILYNDKKFVTVLYRQHGEIFQDFSKVQDAAPQIKDSVYGFLEHSDRAVVIVDCENADPYKLHAMLSSLEQNVLLEKVQKVILYNDIHTSAAWKILDQFTELHVEHHMTTRLKEQKSLVDIELATGLCREYYENKIDSFILVASDSDYFGVISKMPEIRFLVMIEEAKCARKTIDALEEQGVAHCCIDRFCTGSSKIMINALRKEVYNDLQHVLNFNLKQIIEKAYRTVRADMTELEKKQFYGRYMKSMRISFAEDGQAVIQMA